MDNLWTRRTNTSKLSLSTSGSGLGDSPSANRNAASATLPSFPRRFGGDSSSHGKNNPFSAVTPGGSLMSPTGGASSAFALGSGAFASFGLGSAKTPKSPGNPFDFAPKSATSTPAAEKSAAAGGLGGGGSGGAPGAKSGAQGAAAVGATGGAASVSSSARAGASDGGSVSSIKPGRHGLRNEWVFWFRPPISKANGFIEYEKTLHAMAGVATVEDFFAVYAHLKRPSSLPMVSDYHLFKKGIRPIWEDDVNKKGGKWIVRLKKGVADRYWEDLLLALIGDQFSENSDEVCGAVLSVRNGEDILSIWIRQDGGKALKIRETMKKTLNFPADTKIEWKSHDSSIQQRTALDDSRREKAAAAAAGGGGGGGSSHHNNNNNGSSNSPYGEKRGARQSMQSLQQTLQTLHQQQQGNDQRDKTSS